MEQQQSLTTHSRNDACSRSDDWLRNDGHEEVVAYHADELDKLETIGAIKRLREDADELEPLVRAWHHCELTGMVRDANVSPQAPPLTSAQKGAARFGRHLEQGRLTDDETREMAQWLSELKTLIERVTFPELRPKQVDWRVEWLAGLIKKALLRLDEDPTDPSFPLSPQPPASHPDDRRAVAVLTALSDVRLGDMAATARSTRVFRRVDADCAEAVASVKAGMSAVLAPDQMQDLGRRLDDVQLELQQALTDARQRIMDIFGQAHEHVAAATASSNARRQRIVASPTASAVSSPVRGSRHHRGLTGNGSDENLELLLRSLPQPRITTTDGVVGESDKANKILG